MDSEFPKKRPGRFLLATVAGIAFAAAAVLLWDRPERRDFGFLEGHAVREHLLTPMIYDGAPPSESLVYSWNQDYATFDHAALVELSQRGFKLTSRRSWCSNWSDQSVGLSC